MMSDNFPPEADWGRLMAACGVSLHLNDLAYVTRLYGRSRRRYHNLDHIRFCFEAFEEFKHLAQKPHLVRLAIWFHDAVYEPGATDNERKSAELFLEFAEREKKKRQMLSSDDIAFVQSTILATTHKEEDLYTHPDCLLMLDMDLRSLAAPWEEFKRNSADLQKEQEGVPGYDRQAVLRWFLSRDRVFYTPEVHEKYEKQAISNLMCALES